MGCDIHARAEVRRDEVWEAVGAVFPDQLDEMMRLYESSKLDSKITPSTRAKWEAEHPVGRSASVYQDRDYEIFGILANVRSVPKNGLIAEPRGLPGDMAFHPASREELEEAGEDAGFWFGDHSFSWLTLREILAYRWPAEHVSNYRAFFRRMHLLLGVIVPEDLMREAFPFVPLALEQDDKDAVAVLDEWLADRNLPSLDDVRMVFGFDS